MHSPALPARFAEVYVSSSSPRPVKELEGFKRVSLNPGETKNVVVKLDRRAFSYYHIKSHSWTVAPGDFDLFVARSAADIALTGKVALH